MNCRHCGTPLPHGALFCVECGRSVADREPVVAWIPPPPGPAAPAAPEVGNAEAALRAPHCPQCGTAIDEVDIFCGECGFVLRPITEVFETAAIRLPVVSAPVAPEPEPEPAPEPAPEPEPEPEPFPERIREAVQEPLPVQEPQRHAEPPLEDIETTRIVESGRRGERYVLQFSTGESVVVSGSGLVGRNPAPEPGEYVDDLVAIFDVGKSVSKSHIEFGQESGRFWVADRYSTNGTLVRQPDEAVVRCVPGRRYMIARGTRVEIGEQFFIVS